MLSKLSIEELNVIYYYIAHKLIFYSNFIKALLINILIFICNGLFCYSKHLYLLILQYLACVLKVLK